MTQVTIEPQTMLKVWAYIDALQSEVGGMGYAFLDDRGDLTWTEAFLIPQRVSAASVDFEKDGGDLFAINKAADEGYLGRDDFVWVSWHSHGNIGVSWSGTDEARIEGLGQAGVPAVLSFVGNRDHKYKLRLDMFNVEHHGMWVGHVKIMDMKLHVDFGAAFGDIDQEIADMVKEDKHDPVKAWHTKNDKPATTTSNLPVKRQSEPGKGLERALQISDWVELGVSRSNAEDLVDEGYLADEYDNDYTIGPDGEVHDGVLELDAPAYDTGGSR